MGVMCSEVRFLNAQHYLCRYNGAIFIQILVILEFIFFYNFHIIYEFGIRHGIGIE